MDRFVRYILALMAVLAVTLLCFPISHTLNAANLVLLYTLVVSVIAYFFGRGPSVLASALGVALFDFFFVRPYYTFFISDKQYVVTFLQLLAVSLAVSELTARAREQAAEARFREAETRALAAEKEVLARAAQESELLKARERLQTALLNSISHDLRIPLVSISGALQALQDEGVLAPDERQGLLENALSESGRLNRIVGNLLHMTRLQAGGVQVNLQPQELREIVETALDQLGRPERVKVEIPADLPLVEVDFGLLQQVVVNLLENALKFSDSEIRIGVHEAERAELWVEDRGPGVAEEERAMIFEQFYRGLNAKVASGTGLGLSICKGLVEAQGGTIRYEKAEPGARFVVSLCWARPRA